MKNSVTFIFIRERRFQTAFELANIPVTKVYLQFEIEYFFDSP